MFQRMRNGHRISKECFRVLSLDKEMLLFPIFSGICCLLVVASFAVPLFANGGAGEVFLDVNDNLTPVGWLSVFAFYYVNYFVIIFFNSGLIACAIIRLKGGDPSVGDGMRAALNRLPQIAGWALVSATVGMLLRAIESRSEGVARFVSGLLGMAWTATTYFVVPVMVVEQKGPIESVKRSFEVLKNTWGECLGTSFSTFWSLLLWYLLACLPAVIGIVLIPSAGSMTPMWIGLATSGLLLMLVSLVNTTISTIAIGALYLYASEGGVGEYFDDSLFEDAFIGKAG